MNFNIDDIFIRNFYIEANGEVYTTVFIIKTEPDKNMIIDIKYIYDSDRDSFSNYSKRDIMELFVDEFEDEELPILLREYVEITNEFCRK